MKQTLCCLIHDVIFCSVCGKKFCMDCYEKINKAEAEAGYCKNSPDGRYKGPYGRGPLIPRHRFCMIKTGNDDSTPSGVWIYDEEEYGTS